MKDKQIDQECIMLKKQIEFAFNRFLENLTAKHQSDITNIENIFDEVISAIPEEIKVLTPKQLKDYINEFPIDTVNDSNDTIVDGTNVVELNNFGGKNSKRKTLDMSEITLVDGLKFKFVDGVYAVCMETDDGSKTVNLNKIRERSMTECSQ